MKNIILLLFFCLSLSILQAQTSFVYSSIPDSLKKNADYIFWEHKKDFEVKSLEDAIDKESLAVCVVDQYSKKFNTIYVHYRKGESVSSFKAEIYDASGKLVKKLKRNEIKDVSAVSDFSLFEDDRVMYAEFSHNQYPYTIVFEYEKKVKGLLNYPSWFFHEVTNSGVILSQIKVTVPENLKFNYKEYNLKNQKHTDKVDGKDVFKWTEQNIIPAENKELSPPIIYYEPMLEFAPKTFSEGGLEGDMNSWKDFGKWDWELNKSRDILSPETKEKIRLMVKDAKTNKDKAKILYQYMQDKTRYVSVQLGIGGYQTFPAEYVDTKGYGDCKALSNFMYAMLKEAGIESYCTLINAGRNTDDILTDFPSNQFNHVILCVPQEKDTIWLECTSQQQPFNFLGSFTDDRHALLITENGGKLVKTPKYGKNVNLQKRKAEIKIDENGDATVNVNTSFEGLQYENREGWLERSVKEQKDKLKEFYGISGMEFNSLKFNEFKTEIPSIEEVLDLNIMRFASTSGKRMFIKLNVFNQASYVPKNEERTIPFELNYEFSDIDSINIEIPDGYEVENMPKPIELSTKFGSYTTIIVQNGNKILYIRKYSSEKGIFPATDYKAYYEFRKELKRADAAKLVLVKKI